MRLPLSRDQSILLQKIDLFFCLAWETHKPECDGTSQSIYTHRRSPLSFRERREYFKVQPTGVKREYSGIKSNSHRLRMHFEIERN